MACTNFLNGAEIKEQIEEEIAYANATKYEIRCTVDSNEYGQVYPASVTVIKGESFSLEFTKNPATTFNGWVCVDSSTGEILEDAVIFSNERNVGTQYTVNARLNCERNNLIIKPFCYLETEAVPLPPTIKTIRVARTREDALNGTNLIPLEEFSHYATKVNFGGNADAVKKNIDDHHVKSVWFYMEATDAGSGVGSISVKETFLRQTDGTEVSSQGHYTTRYLNEKSNSIAGVFELNFKCASDGVVRLNFIATDRAGESAVSDLSVDLIKDTVFDDKICLVKNTIDFPDGNGMVDYNFFIAPNVGGYGIFIKDMDGTEHKEGFGDHYNAFGLNEEYIGRLANLVRVEVGYSEDSLSPVSSENISFCEGVETWTLMVNGRSKAFKGDMYRCKIRTDSNRDTYVKAVVADMLGNESVTTEIIPKAVSVLSYQESSKTVVAAGDNGEPYSFERPVYTFKPDNLPCEFYYLSFFLVRQKSDGTIDTDILKGGEKDHWDFLFHSPQIANRGAITPESCEAERFLVYKETDAGLKSKYVYISDIEDGIYSVYCVPMVGRNLYSSCVGKPITVYKGVERPAVLPVADSDLPSSFTVTFDPPVVNAGKRTVHIRYPENFTPNPNLNYKIRYRHDANSSVGIAALDDYASTLDFEVPTHYASYKFSVVAYNLAGESRESTFTVSETETLYDNVRPSFEPYTNTGGLYADRMYMVTSNATIFSGNPFSDDCSGLYKNERGKIPVQYFYSGNKCFSPIDWTSSAVRTVEYDENDRLVLPFDGNSGKYLYIRIYDKNGNFEEGELFFTELWELNMSTQVSYSDNAFELTCEWPAELSNDDWPRYSSNIHTYLVAEYFDGVKWKLTSQMGNSTKKEMTASASERTFSYTPEFTSSEGNYIVRLQALANYFFGGAGTPSFTPVYIYPKYYTENITCDLKNFMQGSMGLSVLADNPVLVHTFYSTVNLGNTVEDWLYGGIETGTVQKSKSFTYGNECLAGVPKGKYYTTIIHFADGTMAMTGVNKK
ncbi:MAG: fibronectin type III domain-containing protein [Treponema sp.]|nr:fibronectin type III domain-containing protein [Treponema sp.]